uniref:Uncharacterized protein n=1 Tax=Arundo donax TaxID=35708 RepID=A0A0A8ZV75_ARUDO
MPLRTSTQLQKVYSISNFYCNKFITWQNYNTMELLSERNLLVLLSNDQTQLFLKEYIHATSIW